MEGNPFNNQENNLNRDLENETNRLDDNSQEVSKLLIEKDSPHSEKAQSLEAKMAIALGPFKILSEETLLRQQELQQKEVEEYFHNDPSVEVTSFYNRPNGSGRLQMGEEIKKAGIDSNKVVLLLNGIVNPQDIVQANPHLARILMALLRLNPINVVRYGVDLNKILKGDSISKYITKTTKSIQTELFDGKPIKVMIVRNASSKDFAEVVQVGGEHTVLVVGGHGSFGSLAMTDKSVKSADIQSPQKRLKAFVQHTCAMNTEQEEMGGRFAEKTFGWTRGTNPIDFIENPLRLRTNLAQDE